MFEPFLCYELHRWRYKNARHATCKQCTISSVPRRYYDFDLIFYGYELVDRFDLEHKYQLSHTKKMLKSLISFETIIKGLKTWINYWIISDVPSSENWSGIVTEDWTWAHFNAWWILAHTSESLLIKERKRTFNCLFENLNRWWEKWEM